MPEARPGARFVSDQHGRKQVLFEFAAGLNHDYTHAYQVRRSEFDALLFRRARAAGAEAHEGLRVTEVRLDAAAGHHIVARDTEGGGRERRWTARFLIDASGRDTFLAGQMQSKESNRRHNSAALYGHFRGVRPPDGVAREDGNTTVHLFEHGWFWMIPLPGEVMSVGVVSNTQFFKRRRGSLEAFLHEALAMCPSVAERVAQAELISPVTATGNYTYASKVMAGEGWLMIGDAYAFLDPIFSSGVLLAMASAEMGAEAADTWLDDPARAARLVHAFERKVRRAIDSLAWLVFRINRPVLRDMFMQPSNRFRMREGLVSDRASPTRATTPAALG